MFIERIKKIISEKELTVRELSYRTGIHEKTLYRFLNKETELGSVKLIKLLKSIGIDVKSFLLTKKETKFQNHTERLLENLSRIQKRTVLNTLIHYNSKKRNGAIKDSISFLRNNMKKL